MKIKSPSREEWVDILNKCPDATFFATPEWLDVVEKTFGYKTATKLFVFEDGQRVLVPLSVIGRSYYVFKQYISVPFHNYGGFFSDKEISEDKVKRIVKALKGITTLSVILCPHPFSKVKYPEEYKGDRYSTHILDLSIGFDAIWQQYEDRDQTRKARKEGVTIRLGETMDDFKIYYEMYFASTKRWGLKKTQPFKLYENLCKIARDKIKLWLASYNEKDIAGIILGYFNEIVVYWGGSFFFEYGKLRPNNFLMIEAIRDACEKGCKYFDFLPSAGLEGVERFKENFGAEKYEYYTYTITGKLSGNLSKFKKYIIR